MRNNFFLTILFLGMFAISCNKIDTDSNPSRLFQAGGRAASESAVGDAWSSLYSGDHEAAVAKFAAVLGSGDEEFIAERSAATGLRCGFGYSLLRAGRNDEALYQFEFEADRLIESAIGAAAIYLARREYAECERKFAAFDKLHYESSPYARNFKVFADVNLEAHKILFLAYYYMPRTPAASDGMKTQYSFIAGNTSETGINESADKIFLKIIQGEANRK
jgi:hypothetical protein